MKKYGFLLGIVSCLWAVNITAHNRLNHSYAVASNVWEEGLGNHRAVLKINQAAEVVTLKMEWRRPDRNPGDKRFLIVNSVTGDTVSNVRKIKVDNESCQIQFGPVSQPGTYYFYYLPYQVQTGSGAYWKGYLPDTVTLDKFWKEQACQEKNCVEAEVERLESRTRFDSFYPMEVIATRQEIADYRKQNSSDWYVFPEDRENPIRMREYLPAKWMDVRQGMSFRGKAAPNEYYAFQIGVWSPEMPLNIVDYQATDLTCGKQRIPASAITCFNLEGVDPKGESFTRDLGIKKGMVQPLWFGVDVDASLAEGVYSGFITLTDSLHGEKKIPVSLQVEGKILTDRGDGEPWRHSRLRWLNSTLGEEDVPVKPYTEMQVDGFRLSCLGRQVVLDKKSGLPRQITSWGTDILEKPIRFVVETEEGSKVYQALPQLEEQTPAQVKGYWKAEDAELCVSFKGRMEFDGWMNYVYTLTPKRNLHIKDVRLEIPVNSSVGTGFLGAGLPGQETPEWYDGKWDTPVKAINHSGVSIPVSEKTDWLWPFDSFWIGSAKAGIHCELRGSSYSGPLLNAYHPAYPQSWSNDGKGGFRIRKSKKETLVTVYSGERKLQAGEALDFDFALLVTPVKELDIRSQFTDRYYHNGQYPIPAEEDVQAGVKIINVHHANEFNPYINYPFLTNEKLKAMVKEWHGKGCKVKLYYTLRELTNMVTELWAIRSLGHEILRGGDGGGYPWCREHLVTDYTPQWYHHFDNGEVNTGADAALLTSETDSRWYNYYIEGLRWMVKNLDIDGLYLDDVSFGRDILKRMRRAMDSVKPGCIIDLHSNTGFSRGPANQYAEFFPYINKVWFGESFLYDQMTPANWLIESSGIPFGLMGDMLYRGGNKWLGMQYGMTVRHPWMTEGVVCDPRPVWKLWDEFGIADARMTGFWEPEVPVKADRDEVKVTVYQNADKVLLSLGNYSDDSQSVLLDIDWKKLGLSPKSVRIIAPAIPDFQPSCEWEADEQIRIDPRKGWLIYLEKK